MGEGLNTHYLAAAGRALREWELDVDTITLASHSENVVFKIITSSGDGYALRIHRPGYNTLEELDSEMCWAEALRTAGVDVPDHLLTRDGRGYAGVSLEGSTQTHYVGIIEWVGGELLAGCIDRAEEQDLLNYFEQLGDVIARIHNQAATWTVPADFTRRSWDANGLVGDTPLWGRFWMAPQLGPEQEELLSDVRKRLYDFLIDYGQPAESYSLTHADLHPRNVLVDDRRVQVIDFDDCGFGWHHYEIAVALYDYRYRSDFAALRDALDRGYRTVRNLDPDIMGLLQMFFLIRSLVLVGWINGRPELAYGKWIEAHIETVCREARAFLDT